MGANMRTDPKREYHRSQSGGIREARKKPARIHESILNPGVVRIVGMGVHLLGKYTKLRYLDQELGSKKPSL